MKTLKSITLSGIMILLGFSFCFQGCDKSDDNNTGEYSISGVVEDPVTGLPIAGATVQLLDQNNNSVIQITSDGTGKFTMTNVAKGDYLMKSLSDANYKEMVVPALSIGKSNENLKSNYVAFLPVPVYITVPTGAISGLVLDKDGKPVANANVSISAKDEGLTNGYFAATKTNSEGQYKIGAVSIISPVTSTKIPEFKIKAEKDGYVNVTKGIAIEENYMIVSNPDLVDKPDLGNIVYSDGFESRSWTFTGYWHRQANAAIINQAFLNGFVQLPVGDNSGGAIPAVFAGSYMAWYGDAANGNFLGAYDPGQGQNTGGSGYSSNSGQLTSGPISLAGLTEAGLYFENWFEIESVNPDQYGYDIMEVIVIDAADTTMKTPLGRMNPYSDPALDNRNALAYTSGGFNAVPTWNLAQFDLTPFVGKTVMIRFDFNTLDASYNGFRGWFIDDVTICDQAPVSKSGILPQYPPKPKPRS
jgi:hypothetical protein